MQWEAWRPQGGTDMKKIIVLAMLTGMLTLGAMPALAQYYPQPPTPVWQGPNVTYCYPQMGGQVYCTP